MSRLPKTAHHGSEATACGVREIDGWGRILVTVTSRGVARIDLRPPRSTASMSRTRATATTRLRFALDGIFRELEEWLNGRIDRFTARVDLSNTTSFTREVLNETSRIPLGQTRSYGEIAARIGRPGAARAVGGALGRNPVPILIPCHRVIASTGSLGGFSGGRGLKSRLLKREGHLP